LQRRLQGDCRHWRTVIGVKPEHVALVMQAISMLSEADETVTWRFVPDRAAAL